MRFGEFLVTEGTLDEAKIAEALDVQRYQKKRIGRILLDLGFIGVKELNLSLQKYLKADLPSSLEQTKDDILKTDFSEAFKNLCDEFSLIPYSESSSAVQVIGTAFNDGTLLQFETRLNRSIKIFIVDSEVYSFLEGHLAPKQSQEVKSESESPRNSIFSPSPYTSLFLDLIRDAKNMGASDIHVQPTRDGVEIRFRLDGDMKEQKTLPLEHRLSFINEVKRIAGLSLAVSGKPQDGRVSFNDWQLDLRSSLLPSQFGEKIVLRLLDRNREFRLGVLGFDEETTQDLIETLDQKSGVVIISGPTGSGKTTTLYTLLSEIDRKSRNVITLEDPIEYSIEGLTQVQITPKLSFAAALRSVLRQDPDVILVGEIRDTETADLCIKAASTGHLVLSTIHANSAVDVVGRLKNLGVDYYALKSVLRFSSAQRLVKKLCPNCSKSLSGSELANLGRVLTRENYKGASNLRKRNLTGCEHCREGVMGRVSILEYAKDQGLKAFFKDAPGDEGLSASLRSAFFERALKGEVDATEYRKIG